MRKMICIAVMFGWLAVAANAGTYWVAPADATPAGSNSNDGAQATPWLTISYALANVAAGTPHTINVAAGTYAETASNYIPHNVDNVTATIVGASAATTIVSTSNATMCVYINTTINTGKLTFKNMTFSPTSLSAGMVFRMRGAAANAAQLELEDCIINGGANADSIGVAIESVAGTSTRTLKMTRCVINSGKYGILQSSSATSIWLDDVIINETEYASPVDAICIHAPLITFGMRGSSLSASKVNYPRGLGINFYDDAGGATAGRITNTTIISGGAGGVGLKIGTDAQTTTPPINSMYIAGCDISGSPSHAVLFGGNANYCTFVGNYVHGTAGIGVVDKGVGNRFLYNTIRTIQPFYCKGAWGTLLMGNTLVNLGTTTKSCLMWITDTDAPNGLVMLNNVVQDGTATEAVTDTTTTDAYVFSDYNMYVAGLTRLATIGNATQAGLPQVQAKWLTYSGLFPDNDAHSTVADPLLKSPSTGDFSIPYTSPALNAGYPGSTSFGYRSIGAYQRKALAWVLY